MTRQRWVYRTGSDGQVQAVPILSDDELVLRLHAPVIGDSHYEGLTGPQGEDVSTRTKHREFLKSSGLAMADDFKGEWATAEAQRQRFREGASDRERRTQVDRAFYDHFHR